MNKTIPLLIVFALLCVLIGKDKDKIKTCGDCGGKMVRKTEDVFIEVNSANPEKKNKESDIQ